MFFCPHGDENSPKLTGVASSQEHNKAAKGCAGVKEVKIPSESREEKVQGKLRGASVGGTRPSPFSSPAPGAALGWWKGKACSSQCH